MLQRYSSGGRGTGLDHASSRARRVGVSGPTRARGRSICGCKTLRKLRFSGAARVEHGPRPIALARGLIGESLPAGHKPPPRNPEEQYQDARFTPPRESRLAPEKRQRALRMLQGESRWLAMLKEVDGVLPFQEWVLDDRYGFALVMDYMPGGSLSAPFLLRPTLRGRGFRVGMHRAGRQRGVLGRFSPAFQLLDPCLQSGNLCQQQADDGLGFRRLASDDFFRNSQRHATVVAEHSPPCPDHFSKKTPPGCERLRSGDANKAAARNGGCDRRGTHVAYRQVGFADDSRIAASRRGLRCEQPGRGQRTGVTSARCCKVDLDDPDDRAFHDQDARAYIGAGSATPRPINPTMIETQRRHASVERTGVCRLGRQVIDDAVGAERQ